MRMVSHPLGKSIRQQWIEEANERKLESAATSNRQVHASAKKQNMIIFSFDYSVQRVLDKDISGIVIDKKGCLVSTSIIRY